MKDAQNICNKLEILTEIKNNEETSLKELGDSAAECIRPEIILVRAHEKSADQYEAAIEALVRLGGYIHLDVPTLRKEETARRTKIGNEMLDYIAKGKIIPAECTIALLKKALYNVGEHQNFVLTGFPEEVSQLQLFENTCAPITWEFYLYPADEPPFTNLLARTIETFMHLSHRLTVTSSFNIEDMDKYYGQHLQYVLINGPKLSGKTTIAKMIADKYGYTLVDTAGVTEELKKKLATEETPAESVTVNFDQILEHIADKLHNRVNRKQKFVLDVFPFESLAQITSILNTLGNPTTFLELECPISYVKGRYKIVNSVTELAEDQVAELDKGYAAYEETKAELLKLKENKSLKYCEVKTFLTLDKVSQQLEAIFAAKVVLLRFEGKQNDVDVTLENLAIKYGYLYLNVTALIRQNRQDKTAIGKELSQRKKRKELKREYNKSAELLYGAINYDYPLVLKMIKETIEKMRTNQPYILINNLINSHKLAHADDQLDIRAMDELFLVNKEVGQVFSVLNITTGEYDKTEDIRKAEFLPPKPVPKVEAKKENVDENGEEIKDNPPADDGDEEGKLL